jgi:hypothetical protein
MRDDMLTAYQASRQGSIVAPIFCGVPTSLILALQVLCIFGIYESGKKLIKAARTALTHCCTPTRYKNDPVPVAFVSV